jgi:NADPH:quinone reductase-like Zn-dependent oxidoreductase
LEQEVQKLTGGRGVDHVIEVGGVGTLSRSFQAVAFAGKVALIGVLAGPTGDANPLSLMIKSGSLQGIFVGNRRMFEEMNVAIEVNKIRPIIEKVFPFEQAVEAYRLQLSGQFMGKIVIQV